jgi:hypothetical protein
LLLIPNPAWCLLLIPNPAWCLLLTHSQLDTYSWPTPDSILAWFLLKLVRYPNRWRIEADSLEVSAKLWWIAPDNQINAKLLLLLVILLVILVQIWQLRWRCRAGEDLHKSAAAQALRTTFSRRFRLLANLF